MKNGLSCTLDACAFCILHSVNKPVSSVCIRIGHVTGPRFANAPVKPGSYVGKICAARWQEVGRRGGQSVAEAEEGSMVGRLRC